MICEFASKAIEKENLGGAPYVRINGTEIMSQASPEKLLARIGELLMGAA